MYFTHQVLAVAWPELKLRAGGDERVIEDMTRLAS
jgi:hypothetical protein